jgi:tetratricopeptide (TPR) repeat protein
MSETVAARWEEYNEAGRRSVGLGQLAEAEELFRAAVREGEQLGADSPHLATSLNALGQLRLQAKDVAEAEQCFTRALAIRQQTYGPDSHAIVPSLNNLSALHDAKGETDKAVELLKRSLDISEKALGGSHPEVTLALNNLAKLYFKRRDFSKADRILLRLLETKRALGKDHPEVATVLGSLAKLRQAVNKHGPGEQLWRQALAIRERAFAPNDPILATTLENVADCCAAQEGKLGEAIALRERAIAIRETAMGSAHPSLASARAKLDELRGRPGAAAATATNAPAPLRTSQEVPSPLLSAEVPPFPAAAPSAPTPDLPWIQVDAEPTGERPAPRLELMATEPPSVASPRRAMDRTPSATPRPPVVPPKIPPMPSRASSELVFTDSLAPEATPPQPRYPDRGGRRAPSAPPPPPPARAARPRTPPRSHAAPPRAPVRMPSTMTEADGRSKKALLFAMILVVVAGGSGWFALTRKAATPATLLAAPIARSEPTPAAVTSAAVSSAGPRAPITAAPPPARLPDSAKTSNAAKEKPALTRAGTPRLEVDLATPSIPASVDVDAVTRGIEQSTKAKVDSAQKPPIDVKPIFKKP